jgi:hypothetical protein
VLLTVLASCFLWLASDQKRPVDVLALRGIGGGFFLVAIFVQYEATRRWLWRVGAIITVGGFALVKIAVHLQFHLLNGPVALMVATGGVGVLLGFLLLRVLDPNLVRAMDADAQREKARTIARIREKAQRVRAKQKSERAP